MTTLRFDLDSDSATFETGSSYPTVNTARIFGIADRTADGSLQYEELGITTKTRTLQFSKIKRVDYETLIWWFTDIAQGAKNTFTLTDEYGEVFDVRITDQQIAFTEIYLDTFEGSFTVEVV